MVGKLIGHELTFAGALFNQLTLYVTHWRRNYLHKKGIRVKVSLLIKKNFLRLYILIFEDEYAFLAKLDELILWSATLRLLKLVSSL